MSAEIHTHKKRNDLYMISWCWKPFESWVRPETQSAVYFASRLLWSQLTPTNSLKSGYNSSYDMGIWGGILLLACWADEAWPWSTQLAVLTLAIGKLTIKLFLYMLLNSLNLNNVELFSLFKSKLDHFTYLPYQVSTTSQMLTFHEFSSEINHLIY